MSTPKPKEGRGRGSYVENPICDMFCKKNKGKCLVGTGNCYNGGKSFHMKRDFPSLKTQGKENAHTQESGLNFDFHKKNYLYALQS